MASLSFFGRFRRAFQMYRIASKHPKTPAFAKVLPWLSLLYILWPVDVLPDFFPILGQLDDVAIIPLLLWLALQLMPKDIRDKAEKEIIDVEARPSR
jgi:uncharacterized membrane protein YkvA (DUF1232 family)